MSVTRKLLVSAIFLLEALAIYFFLTQQYPISGDDYSYRYQSKLFASGKLWAEDPLYEPSLPFYDCVETYCLRDDQGHRFSKYPPGWPLILAIGVRLRVPWLVDPLLGALLIFMMLQYAERKFGSEQARAVAVFATLCFFLCYYAASFRAHIAAALFGFSAFLLYEFAKSRPDYAKLCLFGVGALLGYSAMVRYLDWIPLAAWIGLVLIRKKRFADMTSFGLGFVLLASGNLIYNALLSGNPLEVPTAIHRSLQGGDRLVISWEGFFVTMMRMANLLWVFPPVILLAVFWKRYQTSFEVKMCVVIFLLNVAIYFFYSTAVGGPGPRYLLAGFPFLILAVADISHRISRDSSIGGQHIWRFAVAALILCNLVFLAREGYTIYGRQDLQRTVQHVHEGKSIFLLKTGTYRTAIGDLTRNPTALSSAHNLFFAGCDKAKRDELLKRFRGYNVFIYEYPGHLTKVSTGF